MSDVTINMFGEYHSEDGIRAPVSAASLHV